ncbi:amidohydrolase [Hymenobacter cavernae]|nr:amidohydrolase [Hymenobacter cavernae]
MKKLLLLCWWSLALVGLAQGQQAPPDIVLLNGRIFTADSAQPRAQALAIRGERIVAVGTTAAIAKLAGPKTRRIDVRGRTITPGFNDAHNHFAPNPVGVEVPLPSLDPSWEQTAQALTAAARQHPAGTRLFLTVGITVILDERATRQALDQLAPNHPVHISTYFGHGRILNSRALTQSGITDEEPDPVGGSYGHTTIDGRTVLDGRIGEYAQWKPERYLATQLSDDEIVRELRKLGQQATRYGITSLQLFPGMPPARFVPLLQRAALPVRVRAMSFAGTTPKGRDTAEMRQITQPYPKAPRITISGIKWILDGTPLERGAALRHPYLDRPNWSGELLFTPTEINRMVQESLQLRQPLLLHCVGDQTLATVLATLEYTSPSTGWPARRVRLEHADGLVSDLAQRARQLGVVVVQNPSHFTETKTLPVRWGPTLQPIQPLKSLVAAGIPVALGSDGPLNPFLNLLWATTHPISPTEALTREQAVRAYTYGAAFAEFAETSKGKLAKGQLADIAVLSQDIFSVSPAALVATTSVLTLVGGQVVYDAKVLK